MTVSDTSRSFARVDVRIPVRLQILDAQQAAELAERLEMEPTYAQKLSIDHPGREARSSWERLALYTLIERLEKLERGLEKIADNLGVSLADGPEWIEGETVSLSGSGAGLRLPRKLEEGTPVEVEFTLLGEPTGVVRILGHIVTLVHPDGDRLPVGRYHLGVAFDAFHDDDRQAIIRYTFAQQRAQIREMRADEDP
ncbi:MAG: PilZ domain-containing protein [Acidobacteriota bacterium]|nr:PilZ domain-containing protein [Acidobacteriota bacterium]